MTEPDQRPAQGVRSTRQCILDAAAIVVCVALAAIYLRHDVLDADEAIFSAVARRMARFGLSVYEAGWDHKPPGIYVIYRWIMVPFADTSMLGPHIANAAVWVATALCCGRFASRVLGRDAFAPTVAAYALLRSFGEWKAGSANTEAFLQLPLALGLGALLRGASQSATNAFLGGACIAFATWLKTPAALFGPAAIVAVHVLRGWRAARTAAIFGAAGAASVIALEVGRLVISGDYEGWWICNVSANSSYMVDGDGGPALALAAIWREIALVPAPWVLAAVGVGAAAVGWLPVEGQRGAHGRRWALVTILLLACGLFLVTLGARYFRHYWWLLHPALAVAVAAGVVALMRIGVRGAAAWGARAALVVVVALGWIPAQRVDKRRMLASFDSPPYAGPTALATARAIQQRSEPDDTIFVWGVSPELYILSARAPATRIVTCKFLTGSLREDIGLGLAPPEPGLIPAAWPRFLDDVRAYQPRIIVDTSPSGRFSWDRFPPAAFPELAALLESQYERAPGEFGGCGIYVRR
ncbi:MAG: hypothetical protein K8T90_13375 [Planctomycetes bacterium]|nr:hypothetical protein [Planctomycetota bacterium]